MSLVCDLWIFAVCLLTLAAGSPPVFIWSSRNLNIKAPSLGQIVNGDRFRDQFSSKIFAALPGTNVALFVRPHLSLIEVLTHGQEGGVLPNLRQFVSPEYHGVTIDRVQDPLSAFQESKDGVRVTDVADGRNIEEILKHSDPHFVNVYKITLPDPTQENPAEVLRSNDALIGQVMRDFQRINHPFVGVLTAEASPEEPSVHVIRKRAAERSVGNDTYNNLWTSKCIKVYFKKIEVKVKDNTQEIDNLELKTKPSVTAECESSTATSITAVYTEEKTIVTIKLSFRSYGAPAKGWTLSGINLKHKKPDTANVDVDLAVKPLDAWASKGFSFHCSKPKAIVGTKAGITATLEVQEMQVQGLMKSETAPFGSAFDCVGFFSMPILIGLLTTLLLLVCTTGAVVAMASIQTPTRFDDPKGEKISVPTE